MAEQRRIRGPISGYDYPVLNAILEWLKELRERLHKRIYTQLRLRDSTQTTQTATIKESKIYSNIETYEIYEDKRTGAIKVRVHRKAERG